jgi:hypothetical protein
MSDEPRDAPAVRRRLAEHWHRRRDLERQLHDGPALRIAAMTLHIGLLEEKLRDGGGSPREVIADLQSRLHTVLQELRAIADQIYPPLLQEAGLGPALRELALGRPVVVRVAAGVARFDPAVEGVAYFAVLDVLEHQKSVSRSVDITVHRDTSGLAIDLGNVDTGRSAAVRDRIAWLGGAVEVDAGELSTVETIKVRIPCA